MVQGQRWMRFAHVPLQLVLMVSLTVFTWGSQQAAAQGLKNLVKGLYGGDGILLRGPPPGSPPQFSHAPHFIASSLEGLGSLNTALASNVGLFAFNSTVSGFTFDIERGVPVRTTESLGPLLAERAPTLGAGKLNFAFAYTRLDFKRFQGKKLNDLSLTFTHEDINGDGIIGPFTDPRFGVIDFETDLIRVDLDLKIQEDVFALLGTYGLTRSWDVGIVFPIVHVRLRATAEATIVRNSVFSTLIHNFDPAVDPSTSKAGGDETGVGDIILRTKYNFLRNRQGWPDLAVVADLKLPTGDEDNLLGTGETNLRALLVASKSFGPLTPHVNIGYEWTTEGLEESNVRYVAGFDTRVHRRLTVALDLFGRWEPKGDGIGDHIVDLAFGTKWNLFDTFLLNGNVQFPLNRSAGLRADVIWTVGAEYTF